MEPTKRDEYLPMMYELMQGGMPIQLPEMSFETDPISKMLQNLALKQMAKYEARKAEISASRNEQSRNYLEAMQRTLLFGDVVHEDRLRIKDEQERRRLGNEILKELLEQEKAKTHTIKIEAKTAEIDLGMMEIQFKKIKNEEENDGTA